MRWDKEKQHIHVWQNGRQHLQDLQWKSTKNTTTKYARFPCSISLWSPPFQVPPHHDALCFTSELLHLHAFTFVTIIIRLSLFTLLAFLYLLELMPHSVYSSCNNYMHFIFARIDARPRLCLSCYNYIHICYKLTSGSVYWNITYFSYLLQLMSSSVYSNYMPFVFVTTNVRLNLYVFYIWFN